MSEAAYRSIYAGDTWSWTARFRLPEVLPRSDVLAEIHNSLQAIRYSPHIPLEKIAEYGLSGVLIGPDGDDDAEYVQDVIFATDPSKKFGERAAHESDPQAVRIAELNEWTYVDNPVDLAADESDIMFNGSIRVIMGRNKDLYGGEAAFTLQEAERMLPPDTLFETSGGYLFSDRPISTSNKPYGEPAIILTTDARTYDLDMEQELFNLALGLNRQHRFVLETPWGTEVFEINQQKKS